MLSINQMTRVRSAPKATIAEKQTLRLVVGKLQKCLTCRKTKRLIKGKFVSFPKLQSITIKFKHSIDCSQIDKF